MMPYKGIYRHIRKILHIAYITCLGLFLAAILLEAGCARRELVREPVPVKRWACDREADEALKRHEYEEGIRLHRQFLEREPENALALYHLGYAYGQTGDHEKEVRCYERSIGFGFKEDTIFFNLGMAYGELNRIDEAIDAFKEALGINPRSADNHFGLALAYQRGVADNLAEEEFLKAIEIDPAHVDARLHLSMLYADKGELNKAAEQLRGILEIDPYHTGAREFLRRIEGE
jgi:tetratricopeptide (TPR) repeat protein